MELMIDIETMGTGKRSAIVAIGAVKFELDKPIDAEEGCFYRNVNLQSCINAGLQVDGATVYWWLNQSQEARDRLIGEYPMPLARTLRDLAVFAESVDHVWSHGAGFDLAILSEAYRAVNMGIPWGHQRERDTRTLFDLVPESALPDHAGVRHDALDDAISQAEKVQACYRWLKEKLGFLAEAVSA